MCVCVCVYINVVLVAGNWGDWTAWGNCSEVCGFGTRSRRRKNGGPTPETEETLCHGDTCPSTLADNVERDM